MALYFLDSSALVKRYISETGSAWVLELFTDALNNEIFIAAIAKVEIVALLFLVGEIVSIIKSGK
jgi:predicted nucleic acid-binding protein